MPRRRLPPDTTPTAIVPAAGPVRTRRPQDGGPDWLRLEPALWVQSPGPLARTFQLPVGAAGSSGRTEEAMLQLDAESLDLVFQGSHAGSPTDDPAIRAFVEDLRGGLAARLEQVLRASGSPLFEAGSDRLPRLRFDWPSATRRDRRDPARRRKAFRARTAALAAFAVQIAEAEQAAAEDDANGLVSRIAQLLTGQHFPSDLCLWCRRTDAAGSPLPTLRLQARTVGDYGLLADPERLVSLPTGLAVLPPLPDALPPLPEDFALRLCLLIARAADLTWPAPAALEVALWLVSPQGVVKARLAVPATARGYALTLSALRFVAQGAAALTTEAAFACAFQRLPRTRTPP